MALVSGQQYLEECTQEGKVTVIGCDEAGRGPLAGPVSAGAVILPEGFSHPKLNDSKQMSEKDRDELREIIEREAVAWAVSFVSAQEIDALNILRASITAMHRAVDDVCRQMGLSAPYEGLFLLVDGNRFLPYHKVPFKTVIKGDGRVTEIAAASVLAKTHRDEHMRKLAQEYPQYGWERNMAYPTAEHREAIRRYGITEYHRKSFKLLPEEDNVLF